MPKRNDLKTILVIGSGPIVIGQACEFDYSGTQGIEALRREGYRVILANSNPATIMTDAELSDRTYIEPLTPEHLTCIIEKERPEALLPTLGGQTALNLAVALDERGVLKKFSVELLGANLETIRKAEDRELFKKTMESIGVSVPKGISISESSEIRAIARDLGFPLIVRPSFTLGGTGGGIAYNLEDLRQKVHSALEASPIKKVLLEESVLGWKEFELEVMRDRKDNFVVVCSIENLDPMGIHTGDSITVAPSQTLSDRQYQEMRDCAKKIVSAIGVDTGGCNIQFAVHPQNGRMAAIEINPRVSRSSALASKATGFPIAKIAALLAVGYTLDEIPNAITKATPASFEPSIDYVVTKIPRFASEKFGNFTLDTAMKSVGETMAIGRTFKESFQKALRGLELSSRSLPPFNSPENPQEWMKILSLPSSSRIFWLRAALKCGLSVEDISAWTSIDPWFIHQIKELTDFEEDLRTEKLTPELLRESKGLGFSDAEIARIKNTAEASVRNLRKKWGIKPTYKIVDSCAGEFPSTTPYAYSTYLPSGDLRPSTKKKKVLVIGSGPNRIGQGIEFDYCCVQALNALRKSGFEALMVNSNPETVSTDYDHADRLYFEPLALENVLEVIDFERPQGVIVQFGGQTPLNLAKGLESAGAKILGTSVDSINRSEDRKLFARILKRLQIPAPEHGTAKNAKEAVRAALKIGFPVMVRPSFVLGGQSMAIVDDAKTLRRYLEENPVPAGAEIFIDRFLSDATEVDVDAVSDGANVYIAGIMEHIEEAGIHSGDSACTLPPRSLSPALISTIASHTRKIARALKVKGLINIQFAVKDGVVYVIEANPRASRTIPFLSKATGISLAQIATKTLLGMSLKHLLPAALLKNSPPELPFTATKEVVLPFIKFPGIDPRLGPEMKSTGEVMGLDSDFPRSFVKSQEASGILIPKGGAVFISVRDEDKFHILATSQALKGMGFSLIATPGTHSFLLRHGIESSRIAKIGDGKPDVVDLLKQRNVTLAINTPSGQRSRSDGYSIRRTALELNIPCVTNIRSCQALVGAIAASRKSAPSVKPLQDYYRELPYLRKVEKKKE